MDATTYEAWEKSPFGQCMAQAAAAKRTHHRRAAEQTQAHFERHPECLHPITGMDAAGNVKRDTGRTIDVAQRCSAGWWTLCRMGRVPDVPGEGYIHRLARETKQVKEAPLWWQLDEGKKPIEMTPFLKDVYAPAMKRADYRFWWRAGYVTDAAREQQAQQRRRILMTQHMTAML